jgi:hypothetical protein
MPHVLKMKDGKLLTPFGIRDLLDAVQDYAGEELRWEIEEYIETNVQDIDDYEKEYDRMEQENERLADHQRSVLCDIRDEVDALDTLLQDYPAEPQTYAGCCSDHPADDQPGIVSTCSYKNTAFLSEGHGRINRRINMRRRDREENCYENRKKFAGSPGRTEPSESGQAGFYQSGAGDAPPGGWTDF